MANSGYVNARSTIALRRSPWSDSAMTWQKISATVMTAIAIQNGWRLTRPSKLFSKYAQSIARHPFVLCRGSVAQQFVDAGLAARLFVDALDDDRAIKIGRGYASFAGLAWHRAGYDDGVGGHFTL